MARYIIYSKDGNQKAMTDGVNVGRRSMPELEYSGTFMGECFVTVTVKSPIAVDWQIGDYLEYRGEKFVLNYDPSVVKKAKSGTYGEGFVYESVKFNALHIEMGDTEFLDEVLSDNHVHYTSLPTFSFFANDINDYADRLQANMNRYCLQNGFDLTDWWMILTPSRSRTVARGSGVTGLAAKLADAWDATYLEDPSTSGEKFNQNVSISNSTVWGGLPNIYNLFGLHYVTKGRTLVIGAAAKIASHVFEYGKGNGLSQIERVADSEQQIVTKLYAYGNSTNLPIRYYAQVNKTCFATITSIETYGRSFKLDIPFKAEMFDGEQNPAVALISRKVSFTAGGNSYTCYCSSDETYPVEVKNGNCYLNTFPDGDLTGLVVGTVITFTYGVVPDKWPAGHYTYVNDDSVLPDNLAINNLMLPGFPTTSLYDWVKANGGTDCVDASGKATWKGHTAYFSKLPLAPYIMSLNADTLGVREASKTWDGSDDTDDIYPTIENTGKDVLVSADVITDNGVFADEDIPNFHVVVKSLGDNVELDSLIENSGEAKISMKDGYCGGREFTIVDADKVTNSTNWRLTLERVNDDALDLYFPYSNNAAQGHSPIANEAYQLRGSDISGYNGDKFVYLGIDMPSTYIESSAEKLLEAALVFLEANDYTQYTFSPKVDEIFMARQHDQAVASRGTQEEILSLHDTIREGDLMQIFDEATDLNVDGTIYIDQIRIREYGNGAIPTYEVTLRNQKSVGTIDRLQSKVDSLTGNGNGTASSGVSVSQTKSLIQQEGDKRYLRKNVHDRSEAGLDFGNFNQGATGASIWKDNDGNWHYEGDFVHTRKRLKTNTISPEQANEPVGVDGDFEVDGTTLFRGSVTAQEQINALKKIVLGQSLSDHDSVLQSSIYNASFSGWKIDKAGNMEVESLKVRSVLEVEELNINRLQAQEGDTIYTDNDQIEDIEEVYDSILDATTYILTFKEKWEGYFTAQRYGNILKGIINTLAANYVSNQQGHGDVVDPDSPEWDEQEEDDANYQGEGNKYFTSWMYVVADRNTDNTLGLNQVRVALYPDNEVAQTKNFPPCINMVVGRWGCLNYATEDPAELASIKKRQSFFYVSSSEGRFMKLNSVSSPILAEGNFGTVLGNIPDFIKRWDSWERLVREHPHLEDRDYLYAQGLIYEDLVHVDIKGAPVPVTVYCGDWVDGSTASGTIVDEYGDTVNLPAPKHGIYYNTKWNEKSHQFESHTVRHNNGTWLCLISQPSLDNGVSVYHEPRWKSLYWRLVDGNGNYTIEFVSSNGYSFRRGYVSTTITPHLFYGNVDITNDVDYENFNWTRASESGGSSATDPTWNAQHTGIVTGGKTLTLTNQDMPSNWSSADKCIFTLTITINDGQNQIIVDNQIIA